MKVLRKLPKSSELECQAIPASYAFGQFRHDAKGTLIWGIVPVALSCRPVELLRPRSRRGPGFKGRGDGGGLAPPCGGGKQGPVLLPMRDKTALGRGMPHAPGIFDLLPSP